MLFATEETTQILWCYVACDGRTPGNYRFIDGHILQIEGSYRMGSDPEIDWPWGEALDLSEDLGGATVVILEFNPVVLNDDFIEYEPRIFEVVKYPESCSTGRCA